MAKRLYILCQGNLLNSNHRYLIKHKALELSLKGYLTVNQQNQMEIEVEGKNSSIEEFVRFIEKGVHSPFEIEIYDDLKGYTKMNINIV